MRTAVLLAGTLCAGPALAQTTCGMSQSALNDIAATTWNQVVADNVRECEMNGSGTPGVKNTGNCVPITLDAGDVTAATGGSLTDAQGNTWSLTVQQSEDGTGNWYGGLVLNGQSTGDEYVFALRLVNGVVYAEQAKGSGWQVTNSGNPGNAGDSWTYVADPGQGSACSGGGSSAASAAAAPAQTAPTSAQEATTPGSGSGNYTLAPFASDSCQGETYTWSAGGTTLGSGSSAIPGAGSVTDAAGNSYTVNPSGDEVMLNGRPATPDGTGSQTSQIAVVDGAVYGQDENTGQWFALQGSAWTPLTGLPTAGQTPTATSRWASPQGGGEASVAPVTASTATGSVNTAGRFSQALGYFEATVAPGGSFTLTGAMGTVQVGQVSAADTQTHVFGISIAADLTTSYDNAVPGVSFATPASYKAPVSLAATDASSARAFASLNAALACVPQ